MTVVSDYSAVSRARGAEALHRIPASQTVGTGYRGPASLGLGQNGKGVSKLMSFFTLTALRGEGHHIIISIAVKICVKFHSHD